MKNSRCTLSIVMSNRSFADVSQAVSLTSRRGEGFPGAAENALETMALANWLTMQGGNRCPQSEPQGSSSRCHPGKQRVSAYQTVAIFGLSPLAPRLLF